jgi:dihydroorotase
MMDNLTLIKNVTIADGKSNWNKKKCDILVNDDEILEINNEIINNNYKLIEFENAHISPGIFDMQVNCGAPFDLEKESFQSLADAAIYAGITDCLLMPHPNIPVDSNAHVEFIKNSTKELPLKFHIAGAISSQLKGKDLANFNEMSLAGAIAFTDNKKNTASILLHLALQYNKLTKKLLMFHAEDASLTFGGSINEGRINLLLGMKGIPSIAEELGIVKAIYLSKYHNEMVFINGISTKGSVELVREAKKLGVKIGCSVYGYQFMLTENDLLNFNSYLKVSPPLRSEEDQQAIIEGIIDGTIDIICSDHQPENNETKEVEFEIASFGMATIENLWSLSLSLVDKGCNIDLIIEKLCHNPRKLLNLEPIVIDIGEKASFFIHSLEKNTLKSKKASKSKAINNPFFETMLPGRIFGTYTKGQWFENNAF